MSERRLKAIVTPERLEAMRRASARNLPDDPTRRGYKPSAIKDALARPTELLAGWLSEMEEALEYILTGDAERVDGLEERLDGIGLSLASLTASVAGLRAQMEAYHSGGGGGTPTVPTVVEYYEAATCLLRLEGYAVTEAYDEATGLVALA